MQGGLAILKPHLATGGAISTGKAVVGTVKGDLHDIGKNLVAMMLEGAGFEVIDLGTPNNHSGVTSVPRSITSKPAPSSIHGDGAALPMSWRSPLAVPTTALPVEMAPPTARCG